MVDRTEVTQMSKFIAAMNGPGASADSVQPASGEVAEMKLILERFHSAADHVVTEASYDRELREALCTETTGSGTRIGSWEIRLHSAGAHHVYDVVNVLTGEALARDLMLYEAARGLARILNEGGKINSSNAIELLRAEQDYGSLVQDMVLYKHRLTKNTNSPRLAIFEARYGDAKRRAILARDRVYRLADGV